MCCALCSLVLCTVCGALLRCHRCGARYILWCTALHPVVHCVLHPVVHCVLHPVVHCAPCSVLATHVHCRGAVRCALHTVLLVHPSAVHCPLFPVPLHPPLPDLPAFPALRGGGGGGGGLVRGRNGGGVACPPVPARQPKCCRKHPAAAGQLSLVGKGSFVAAGRSGLALRAHRDVGTTSWSGEGACRASRAAAPASGRAMRTSLAPAALRTPV